MKSDLNDQFISTSPLFGGNSAYVEAYYEQYLRDPDSVEPSWREYFKSLNGDGDKDVAHGPIRDSFVDHQPSAGQGASAKAGMSSRAAQKQAGVLQLISHYRSRGHRVAERHDDRGAQAVVPDVLPQVAPREAGAAVQDAAFIATTYRRQCW